MPITKVRDVKEAVALCARLKQDGKYDWFRGQRMDWPLQSSFARLDETQREEALQRMARFERWVKRTPGLEPIGTSADMTIAVAQHYGLPTNFIDFTTDPVAAGFFASTELSRDPDKGEYSCILCLDTRDLEDFWKIMPQRCRRTEFIRLSVPNLWRLEAQSGVFLFCPYANFEDIYDLDRILFPPSRLATGIPQHGYYPKRKSPLEVLLDQFFMNEKLIEGWRATRSTLSRTSVHYWPSPPNRCNSDIILGGDLPIHDSWNPENVNAWLTVSTERLEKSVTNERFHIDLKAADSPNEIGDAFRATIVNRLNEYRILRSRLATFTYRFTPPIPTGVLPEGSLQAVARLWDGLRRLPLTDEEIATGLGNCLALKLWWFKLGQPRMEEFESVASACFGDSQWVEFGASDGSYSRAYAEKNALLGCVRPDISAFLAPQFKKQVEGNIVGMLQGCSDPRKLFDFRLLASLFATQIGPVQVLTRGSEAVYFSPALLDSFGLP
jgi:hypothetical protein